MKVARGLRLPMDAASETFAIVGRRGSGKTHTAVVMAEEFSSAGIPIVVIDPLDCWWGLRVPKVGSRSGSIAIYVCGGTHADIPLTENMGQVLADTVIEQGLPMILSTRHLSKAAQRRFVGEFCERLYERKADPRYQTTLHLIIDEADAFVPQKLMGREGNASMCYGAVDTLVRRGRSSGLATTLITQRPQVIAKDVLSQTEVLVSHQVTSPQDRKALDAWIEQNDVEDRRREFLASLASLNRGEAWFWSPGLLKIFKRVQVRDRHTFDSSRTPKPGVKGVDPKSFTKVDLDRLSTELQAAAERAEEDDPRKMRVRIRELEKELKSGTRTVDPERDSRIIDNALKQAERQWAAEKSEILKKLSAVRSKMQKIHDLSVDEIQDPLEEVAHTPRPPRGRPVRKTRSEIIASSQQSVAPGKLSVPRSDRNGIGRCEMAILQVLAQHPEGAHLGKIALLAGYRPNGGGFRNALSNLRSSGMIDGLNTMPMKITPEGLKLGPFDPLPEGEDLIRYWVNHPKLGRCESSILQVLVDNPDGLSLEEIAHKSGYESGGGGFRNALSKLRTAGLLEGRNTEIMRASDALFG